MAEGYDPRRHNTADRVVIERHELDQSRRVESERQRQAEQQARKERMARESERRPLVRAVEAEIPKALRRLEEQGWPDAERVVVGTVKQKRTWSWSDLRINRKAVFTNATERAAWKLVSYYDPASSGEGYVSGETNITYYLLSTGQIAGGVHGVTVEDLNELNDNDPNAHRSDRNAVITDVFYGLQKLGRPSGYLPEISA